MTLVADVNWKHGVKTAIAAAICLALAMPLEWFPRLRDAIPEQWGHWRFIGRGQGIHWPDLDEDISAAGLMRVN